MSDKTKHWITSSLISFLSGALSTASVIVAQLDFNTLFTPSGIDATIVSGLLFAIIRGGLKSLTPEY